MWYKYQGDSKINNKITDFSLFFGSELTGGFVIQIVSKFDEFPINIQERERVHYALLHWFSLYNKH